MTAPDRPLALGELLSETIRIYTQRPWAAIGLGLVEGGAYLLAALTPDLLDVLLIALAFTLIFGAAARLVSGDTFAEAWAQVGLRAPVLLVFTFIVAVPAVIALTYLFLLVVGALWVALMGFSIPVAMLERDPDVKNSFDRIAFSLLRSIRLARAEYLHALGVIAALIMIYLVFSVVLSRRARRLRRQRQGDRRRAGAGRARALLLPRPLGPLLRAASTGRCILASAKTA